MSLEQALAENTAAIRELVAAWSRLPTNPGTAEVKKEAPIGVKPDPKPVATKATPQAATPVPPASSATPSGAAVEYADLQKAVFALARNSTTSAAAVATSLGVKTFKELPQERWAEALAAVNAKLAELKG